MSWQDFLYLLINNHSMKSPSIWAHIRDILILPCIVCILVPYLLHTLLSGWIPHTAIFEALGGFIFGIGLVLWAVPVYLFYKMAMGTLAPWAPTQRLVITGPYRYVRNPMITGVVFILLGEALYVGSGAMLLWSIWFFCMNTAYFIFAEEPSMTKRFGEDYLRYKANVPRWLPRLTPYEG